MLRFKHYLSEAPRISKIFHNSSEQLSSFDRDPMWFTIRLKDGMGYYKKMKDDGEDAHLYETRFTGDRIANLLNKKEMKKLSQEMEDEFDQKVAPNYWEKYVEKLVENPTGKDVSYMDQTEALSDLGYQAVLYWDYDPRNSNKDLEAFLILDPPNRTSGLKEVKVK